MHSHKNLNVYYQWQYTDMMESLPPSSNNFSLMSLFTLVHEAARSSGRGARFAVPGITCISINDHRLPV